MLSKKKRKKFFEELGLTYPEDISALQKEYMYNVTGVYDKQTENCLKTARRCKLHGDGFFTAKEFRCKCGGRYCNGFPAAVKTQLIKNLAFLRKDSDSAITITSGLRCSGWNARQSGSASRSRHMSGKAVDIVSASLTGSAGARKALIKRWYTFKKANYAYGNTPNMGSAVHLDIR